MTTPRRAWTGPELEQLRRRYADEPTQRIADSLGRSARSLYYKANALGLYKSAAYLEQVGQDLARAGASVSKLTRFKPGDRPWNAGTKGQGLTGLHPNTVRNHFGPGHRPATWLPVGSTRISHDGYLQRKLTDTGYPPRDWVPVHRSVWEAAHGPVPAGHRIVFLGGKPITDEALIVPEALECVTPAEMMRRNSYHRHLPPELARLVQLRGQLQRQIKRATERNGHPATTDEQRTDESTATP